MHYRNKLSQFTQNYSPLKFTKIPGTISFYYFLYFRYILRFPTNFNFKIKSLVVLCFCCVPILIGTPHLFWPLPELLLLLIFFIFSLTCLKHISNRKNQQTKKKQRGPHRTGTRFKTWTQYFPKTYKKRYTPRWTCPNSRPSMCPWVSMSFYLYYSKWTKKTKIKPEMSNKKCRILKDVLRILIIIFKLFQIFL